jgi:hypothetical protein
MERRKLPFLFTPFFLTRAIFFRVVYLLGYFFAFDEAGTSAVPRRQQDIDSGTSTRASRTNAESCSQERHWVGTFPAAFFLLLLRQC